MGDFYFGVRCGSRIGFLSVCACVLGVKNGFVFLVVAEFFFWCVGVLVFFCAGGVVGFGGGF